MEITVEQAKEWFGLKISELTWEKEYQNNIGKSFSYEKDLEAFNVAIKALEENEKLKEELEKETDLVNSQADEIERLEKLHKKYLDMWGKKETNEMSAAEVLEWLMNAKKHDILYDVLRTDNLNFMFNKLTPQEIIERITEYEKNKVDISKTENNTEHVSNSYEFKVGDKVLYKGQKFTIEDMESNDEIGLESEDGICLSDWVKANELKHAETPKEEHFRDDTKMIEWVYELYYRPHATDYFLGYCDTEESAIETCEYYTLNENLFGCNYKKVCRRKE